MLCGLDEAGRGPLAGPVCAAAVVLPDDFPTELLGDSKLLSEGRREKARAAIVSGALAWGVGWASHTEIDRVNILQASLLAMGRAFGVLEGSAGECLPGWPESIEGELPFGKAFPGGRPAGLQAIADGTFCPELPVSCRAEAKADGKFPAVMAASILAKTARDRLMSHYATLYPQYGYERHKGYPTLEHRKLLARFGESAIQRKSFGWKDP